MKNFSSRLLAIMAVGLIALPTGLINPLSASAANTEAIPPAALFCSSINTIGTRIESQLGTVTQQSLPTLYNPATFAARQASIQTELAQKRAGWDGERDQQYNKMLSLAQNDAQKTAIENFKTNVEAAIVVRRSSVDNAIAAYFSNTGDNLSAESAKLVAARQEFVSTVKNAISTAKTDCLTNRSTSEIRSTFQTNIETARSKLQSTRESISEFKSQLTTIRKEEARSINEAVMVFETSLSKARQSLVEELKKSGANTSQFDI